MQNIYDAGIYDCVSSETRDELESSMNILRGVSDNLSATAEAVIDEKPKHDFSFARGWNDVVSADRAEWKDFDAEMYLRGVTEAVAAIQRNKDEIKASLATNEADIQSVMDALKRLKESGIVLEDSHWGIAFKKKQRIEKLPCVPCGDELPF
jgi:hypothetical protein